MYEPELTSLSEKEAFVWPYHEATYIEVVGEVKMQLYYLKN